mmetsp:Transcript_14742/g.22171  ORF Transcript_14742/g.22171 Transcript_14742/m.22171 type:complete len:232 (-) Transcript_14742:143-838(-)
MKLATAVISLVTIIGANGTSTASTKSSKSKASCIESKSGKSSKSGKASGLLSVCEPCSVGSGYFNSTLCGTDAGFCEISINVTQNAIDACDANNCAPDCFYLEPICELCSFGPLVGVDCPQPGSNLTACEFSFSADAEPTCVISDCVPTDDVEPVCGPCSTAPEPYGCPDVDGFCQADFDVDTIVCVQCNETACPDFTVDQCIPPEDETDARRLEMGDKGLRFNNDNVFQW